MSNLSKEFGLEFVKDENGCFLQHIDPQVGKCITNVSFSQSLYKLIILFECVENYLI